MVDDRRHCRQESEPMNKSTMILGGILLAIVSGALIGFANYASYSNQEVALRSQFVAQQDAVLAVYDDTWKSIAQEAQVTDKYQSTFAKVYPALMSGRYGNARGGALMSWVQESNPNLDPSIFSRLSDTIEVNRKTFTREQRKLLDIKREHDNLLGSVPACWFVGGRQHLVAHLITSTRSQDALKTGKDDDISVFGKS